jgi:hypothetical protein
VETWFKLWTTYSDIMINYHLSQKIKLLGNGISNINFICSLKKESSLFNDFHAFGGLIPG